MQARSENAVNIRTDRLVLRKPEAADTQAIFDRYARDPEVCRYLGWPMHRTVDDTKAFLEWSELEWQKWPAGPLLVHLRDGGTLIGGTGLAFESDDTASTGYVLAQDAWGFGYATEVAKAMREWASSLGVRRLYAYCHPDHAPSRHVLEKAGFTLEGLREQSFEFPNLLSGVMQDAVSYAVYPDDC